MYLKRTSFLYNILDSLIYYLYKMMGEIYPATPPGATMEDIICESGVVVKALAERLKISEKHAKMLILGLATIDEKMAHCLEENLGGSYQFWMNREKRYRERLKQGGII